MTQTRVLSCLLGATLLLSAPVVLGQTPKEGVSYGDKEKAKKLAKSGASAYDAGSYEKALKAFQEAYALNPEPKYLPPIGQCYEHLNQNQEAFDAYSKFLAAAEADHPLRAEVQKRQETLQAKLPKQPAEVTPPKEETPTKPDAVPSKGKGPTFLLIGAASSGALSVAAGVFSLLPNNGALADAEKLQTRAQNQARAALVSDILLIAAVGAGVSGFVLSKKAKKNETAQLTLSPAGVAFSFSY
jgi:tetratricopeptide (TPR) repeat protein